MASLREIRRKIKSVKSTQQITKAMKMVAAARMRKAQGAILASRPFAVKMESVVQELAQLEMGSGGRALHPFYEKREPKRLGLILITGDKGLCGAFNAQVLRRAVQWLKENQGKPLTVTVAGRKGVDFLKRLSDVDMEILQELVGIFPKVTFAHAELLINPMLERFAEKRVDSVTVLFNEFKSAVSQPVRELSLLPVPVPQPSEDGGEGGARFGFHYEPGRDALLNALMPRYIRAQIFRVLLESQAAELAARMNAMDAATTNAGELIDNLTLSLNRTRQSIITNEIMEIVGGAEALAS